MKKTVYVLSGGGAKGCFQVGAMKYLHEQGARPVACYGTSVGALNSAGYSVNGIEGMEAIWRSIRGKSDILKFQLGSLVLATGGLYSTRPLRKLIDKHASGPARFCDAVVCKVSLKTGEIAYGRSGDPNFADSVQASAAIPGIMEPVGGEWVDGGVREQSPLKQAFVDHPDLERVVIILCNPYTKEMETVGKVGGSWASNIFRAVDILEHEIFLNDIQDCIERNSMPGFREVEVVLVAPKQAFMDTLDFDPAKIAYGIELGYDTAVIQSGGIVW